MLPAARALRTDRGRLIGVAALVIAIGCLIAGVLSERWLARPRDDGPRIRIGLRTVEVCVPTGMWTMPGDKTPTCDAPTSERLSVYEEHPAWVTLGKVTASTGVATTLLFGLLAWLLYTHRAPRSALVGAMVMASLATCCAIAFVRMAPSTELYPLAIDRGLVTFCIGTGLGLVSLIAVALRRRSS